MFVLIKLTHDTLSRQSSFGEDPLQGRGTVDEVRSEFQENVSARIGIL